jgi:hypothetical protein
MRPHPEYERLNDQLHKHLARWSGNQQSDQPNTPLLLTEKDHEVDRLVALARHLQAAHPLQVNPDFARQLEQRMLLHHLALGHQSSGRAWQTTKIRGSWFFLRPFVTYTSIAVALLCSLLGTSMFALAAQVTNPGNPLYAVKQWEQQIQLSLARFPSNQAKVSRQIAHDRLNSNTKNNRKNKNNHTIKKKKGKNAGKSTKNHSNHKANDKKQNSTGQNGDAPSNGNNSHGYKDGQTQHSR